MDRVDKVLLVMPILPFMDLISTLFSLRYGGEEVGILAKPVLQNYGGYGLAVLSASASILFLLFMTVVIHIKRGWTNGCKTKQMWYALAIPIYWFFILEGVYFSTVVMNFMVPMSPALTQGVSFRAAFVGVYFLGVAFLTLPQMRKLPRF